MIAYVTSIGETTTDYCVWSLQRLGFEPVTVISGKTSLAMKLYHIYNDADDDFLRVDADVVVNKNVLKLELGDNWWVQALTFSWYKQDVTHGGISLISKKALPALRENVVKTMTLERPESHLYRLPEFHNPRRCVTQDIICGIQDYKQNDMERVKATKDRRKQTGYDWELAAKLDEL